MTESSFTREMFRSRWVFSITLAASAASLSPSRATLSPTLTREFRLDAGDLGKYGSFVALSHSLARYVRPSRDWRSQASQVVLPLSRRLSRSSRRRRCVSDSGSAKAS